MTEKTIAHFCGPALAGIKPANIVNFSKIGMPEAAEDIRALKAELEKSGICIEVLCECSRRVLVMVYRKEILKRQIEKAEVRRLLHSFGYGENTGTDECIEILKSRMAEGEFPHEIGVFLGYPPHDVRGFIKHGGKNCLLSGEWKVYKNAEEAKALFSRYNACRRTIVKKIEQGKTLAEIFCA